ncbi:MAG TPA: hypothetical protein VI698_05160 [Nitrososphaerales archaeon]|nr:hypothetical protein [Nitrososphaerales archaeon]
MVQKAEYATIQMNVRERVKEKELRELQDYFASMPIEEILLGLRFEYKRWMAKKGGFLMVGRKSKIKREVHLLTAEQVRWRLKNWKMMIKSYRERGYSYPTISRIKKALRGIAKS